MSNKDSQIFLLQAIANAISYVIKNAIGNKFANVKTVKAEVIDKYKSNIVLNYPGALKQERDVVVFKQRKRKYFLRFPRFHIAAIGFRKKER